MKSTHVSIAALVGLALANPLGKANQGYNSNPSRFKFFTLPQALSGPCDLATAPDNSIWVSNILKDTVARVDPVSGSVEEYAIPYNDPSPIESFPGLNDPFPLLLNTTSLACVMRTGSDGNMYAYSGIRNKLVRIDPVTRNITVLGPFPGNPFGNLLNFNDAWTGDTGMFFSQTTGNDVTFYNYNTGTFTNFVPETPASGPLGMRTDEQDHTQLWFTEFFASKVSKLNSTSGEITEFPLPLPLMGPSVLRVQEGNIFWFVLLIGNGLGKINKQTGEINLYFSPTIGEIPAEEAADLKGNIWFSAFVTNTLNYFNPNTETFHQVNIPGGSLVDSRLPPQIPIAIHYYVPGNTMWFTVAGRNQVGYYVLDPHKSLRESEKE